MPHPFTDERLRVQHPVAFSRMIVAAWNRVGDAAMAHAAPDPHEGLLNEAPLT